MPDYCIGLDLGTTSTKAIALTTEGAVLAVSSAPNRLFTTCPGSGWQDPLEVWRSAVSALLELSKKIPSEEAIGICLSGAMHSLFPAGADCAPLMPAVTWADVRAGKDAMQLRMDCDAHALYLRTGCPLQYLYHPAKLHRWIAENPELRNSKFAALKDYILYRLTGEWVTDSGLASATGLMDTRRFLWDPEALRLGGIQENQLPALVSSDAFVGGITREAASLTGFRAGLPVIAGAGDGGLANLGAGAVNDGQTVITVGTSGAVRRITGTPILDEAERTWCYLLLPGRWFYGGATNNAGLAVQWVRERFYPDLPGALGYDQLFQDAAGGQPGAEGVVMAPYFAGERNPHWDANARAAIHGLALDHTRVQIARAVLEGVGFCLKDIWDAMGANPLPLDAARLTGMINSRPVWAQILADQMGVKLSGLEAADASAIGAAMLGIASLSSEHSLEELAVKCQPTAFYEPNPVSHVLYQSVQHQFQMIYALRQASLSAS